MFAQIVLRPGQGTRVEKCVLRFDGWCRGVMDDECHDEKRERVCVCERESIIRR